MKLVYLNGTEEIIMVRGWSIRNGILHLSLADGVTRRHVPLTSLRYFERKVRKPVD